METMIHISEFVTTKDAEAQEKLQNEKLQRAEDIYEKSKNWIPSLNLIEIMQKSNVNKYATIARV